MAERGTLPADLRDVLFIQERASSAQHPPVASMDEEEVPWTGLPGDGTWQVHKRLLDPASGATAAQKEM